MSDARTRRHWLPWALVIGTAVAIGGSFLVGGGGGDAGGDPGSRRKPTPVTAEPVKRQTVTLRGEYPGELDADSADIAAYFAGRLVEMHVRVGDTVEAGAVIAELDPVDLNQQIAQARAQVKAAAAEERRAAVEVAAAEADLARTEALPELVSVQELDTVRARVEALRAARATADAREAQAQAQVGVLGKRAVETRVKAPFAGRIADRYVDPGATVAAGSRLVRLVQTSPLRVRFEVPEADLGSVAVGAKVVVKTQVAADRQVVATVTGVASEVNRERRVAVVEGLVEDPPTTWLPGMYATATADLRSLPDATTVPSVAVLTRLRGEGVLDTGVFVADGATARWVPVRVLGREGDRTAIEGELPADARVLVAGHIDLANGATIQVIEPAARGAG
jgi:RND family efflux transporter MFP subunit